jgi:hypothetical protein
MVRLDGVPPLTIMGPGAMTVLPAPKSKHVQLISGLKEVRTNVVLNGMA